MSNATKLIAAGTELVNTTAAAISSKSRTSRPLLNLGLPQMRDVHSYQWYFKPSGLGLLQESIKAVESLVHSNTRAPLKME